MNLIKTRRSVREFSSRQIGVSVVREVLEAARWAPSAHNAQPWRFIIVTTANVKHNLAQAMADAWKADLAKDGVAVGAREKMANASVDCLLRASVLVVACISTEGMIEYADEARLKWERDLALQSLGAAIQNLLLAAHANELGACWFSAPAFCKKDVREVLKVPLDVEPQALIAMGYPAGKPKTPSRKTLAQFVYWDYWGRAFGQRCAEL
ncbi:MAG: nitroreductase family protein [Candidatus Bathyarchaeota archaeon]|nr:nitroreductase family protein [Candidatus Bathyarchaeota archaeon]